MKKESRQLISALICLCLLVGMIPIGALTAFAADTVTAATAYADGSGTKDDPYQISNAAELLYFNEQCASGGDFDNCGKTLLVENYHGAYFVLTDDIDCSGITVWTPCCFAGNFDGQGHTISNLNIGYTAYNNNKSIYSGFFETFYEGTFQNLTFKGCKVEIPADLAVVHYANIYVGLVAAEAYYAGIDSVTVDSCSITNNPTTTTFRFTYIGGIAGGVDGVYFNRCMITNTAFNATNAYMGGIVGQLVSMYYDASELIDLGVPLRFGGGAGKYGIENSGIDAKTTITNTLTYPDNYNYPNVGGMIGLWQPMAYDGGCKDSVNGYIKNNYCNAALNVTGGGAQGIGSFVGEFSYAEYPVFVENCYFAGSITDTAANRTGKGYIIGYATRNDAQSLTINNCYGADSLSLNALGEDRKYNTYYGGNTVKEMLGCATFGSNGVLTAEIAGDTLAADNLLDALNAWVTKNNTETSSYLAWGKAESYPFFSADYTKVDEAIAKIPADLSVYTDTTVTALNNAVNAVVRGKNISEQATVDGYATTIENTINALEYKGADYSKVDEAIAKANALSKDNYKDFSAVEDAVNAVVRGKNISEQATVDGYAADIENAINALEYKDADYSKVDEAIAKANVLSKDNYKDFSAVEAAVNAVVRGKNITEQATIDGYATAIETAINALEYKDADYSKVDEAIAKANALNKDNYKDFTAVENAISAIVRDKNITEQADVDAMEKAIADAISALEKKPSTESGTTTKPTEPNAGATDPQTDTGNNNTNTTSPQTGDNGNMFLWIALLFVSGGTVIILTAYDRKKKKANR